MEAALWIQLESASRPLLLTLGNGSKTSRARQSMPAGNPYRRERLSTIDLHVLTSLNLLL
jgi:hypothetical protein